MIVREIGTEDLHFALKNSILHSLREDKRCRPPMITGDGLNINEVYKDGKIRIELDDLDIKE